MVFGTYSALRVADETGSAYEKMAAVYTAFDNTQALIRLLRLVYHNVKHYFQMQLELHDVGEVLSYYFDDFGQKVIEAYIRPLKIKDLRAEIPRAHPHGAHALGGGRRAARRHGEGGAAGAARRHDGGLPRGHPAPDILGAGVL